VQHAAEPADNDDFEWPPRHTEAPHPDTFDWPPSKGGGPWEIAFLDPAAKEELVARGVDFREHGTNASASAPRVSPEPPAPDLRNDSSLPPVFPAENETVMSEEDPPATWDAWLREAAATLVGVVQRWRDLPRPKPASVALVGLGLLAAVQAMIIWRSSESPSTNPPSAVHATPPPPAQAPAPANPEPRIPRGAKVSGTNQNARKAELATAGRLVVSSEPRGAQVSIDGRVYGVTPITLNTVSPGVHQVVLKRDDTEVAQTIRVEAGQTVTVVAPMQPQTRAMGYLAIDSAIELEVIADGVQVGNGRHPVVRLEEGPHEIELVNKTLGYRERQTVRILAGSTVSVAMTLPQGVMQIDAVPWADVWVDGKWVGRTPIEELAVTIGAHEVVFRHPDLGAKTVSTVVKAGETSRVSVQLTGQPASSR
jgi:hypothetical protein